ncbi:nicotinamide adenine dinucleotide transporter 2 [Hibiscus syriacus]|uniref:Nicotinamide adenine dinucleotide transporter 2 n=1 Tax=Hibiscus syriacus TaxID=106335 RepID=A0A6A2Z8E6_HIBSY|nr:uncharacterized protein LOC120148979 [Hibiscus syriacus]KAE8688264.1 nicotinamide adenine dinucleotide transporter 2 [Hibiscus syriacus]
MTTLQKFKLLATHCGVTQSPTRSPRTSPLVNFRRPKTTLRMLLTRTGSRKSSNTPQSFSGIPAEKKKGNGHSLKDLFVSSPSLEGDGNECKTVEDKFGGKGEVVLATKVGGLNGLGGEPGSPRPGWMGFRHRMLLRKAWRPTLQTIHE